MSDYEPQYRPFRLLQPIQVSGSVESLREHYPNAIVARNTNGTLYGHYKKMSVVNVPSEAELAQFLSSKSVAMEIPQDERGFDTRDSGVARSVPSSIKAQKDGAVEASKQKFAKKNKDAKDKAAKEPVIETDNLSEPEPKTK